MPGATDTVASQPFIDIISKEKQKTILKK